MRIFLLLLLCFQCLTASTLYEGDGFVLLLEDDQHFKLYPQEQTLKFNFAGAYVEHEDSLILSTHQDHGESVILAIYRTSDLVLSELYTQNVFSKMLPSSLYISKIFYANGSPKREYFWNNHSTLDYQDYSFNPEKWVLSMASYVDGKKQGKELLFFNNPLGLIQAELHYKEGLLSGKSYYYNEQAGDQSKVSLARMDKYKEGKLIRSKKPEVKRVYYTSHF